MSDERDVRVPDEGGEAAGGEGAPGSGASAITARHAAAEETGDVLAQDERRSLERWQPAGPPAGFADRVLAARADEVAREGDEGPRRGRPGAEPKVAPAARSATAGVPRAGSPRRALLWGAGGLAAVMAAAVALTLAARARPSGSPAPHDAAASGAPAGMPLRRLDRRESLELGGRGVAVAEAGAVLTWRRDGAATRIEQRAGEVFYRVDSAADAGAKAASFTVVTAAGEVRVTGTCFRVEVIEMQPLKQGLIGAVAGAAIATAAVVTVYEGKVSVASPSGTAQVRAGERATLTPDQPPSLSAEAPPQAVAIAALPPAAPNASREELLARDEAMRQQVAQLSQRVRQLQSVAPPAPGPGGGGGPIGPDGKRESWLDKTPEQLLQFARECRVQLDFPPLMRGTAPRVDAASVTALDLSSAQVSDANQVFATLQTTWAKRVRGLYLEATADTSGADSLSAQAMGQELQEKAAPGEPDALQKRIAEERAGLLQVPDEAALAKASPFERYFRALANLGDEAEQALAVVLGGEKAHALRARNGGWPQRMGLAGCSAASGGGDGDGAD